MNAPDLARGRAGHGERNIARLHLVHVLLAGLTAGFAFCAVEPDVAIAIGILAAGGILMRRLMVDAAARTPKKFAATVRELFPSTSNPPANASPRSRGAAAVLCGIFFIGIPVCGLHRFYVGRHITGFLWLFTFGLMGIGQLIDFVLIVIGSSTDVEDRPVTTWWDRDDANFHHRTEGVS
jgi:hypothetical protein